MLRNSLETENADFCPNSEWASFDSCLFFSTLAHTFHQMSGGKIPVSNYRSSTQDALRLPVISLHAWLSSGFRWCMCADISYIGQAYSATE